MSPLSLRRYRAERLLRQEFERMRGRVLALVRGRLGASGGRLDQSDLDACYAQAWQGLYAAILDGKEIANPTGWLAIVTYRRAVEELRADRHIDRGDGHRRAGTQEAGMRDRARSDRAQELDFAAELDDRMRLHQLFEGLRGRLSAREREAAACCYLQGLSRSEAAERMGISESRMRKLMDGRGAGRPGVAGKVGELAETISAGGWCEEQGSLMRALAYGMLDPAGERYRLAVIHRNDCPACRAYVVSLRGLAAVLPPVLAPWGLAVGALGRAGSAAHGSAGIGAHPGAGAQAAAGTQAGAGAAGGVVVTGAAGAGAGGAAGGGWLLAGGPFGAKLAVGCLLALGVGAGCVALTDGPDRPRSSLHGHRASSAPGAADVHALAGASLSEDPLTGSVLRASTAAGTGGSRSATPELTPAQKAAREFGPERGSTALDPRSSATSGPPPTASSASSSDRARPAATSSSGREFTAAGESTAGRSASPSSAGNAGAPPSAAEREFGVG